MLWLVGLSAGLIDDLLLLPQDYRLSSLGGEGNSSEHSGEKQRGEGTERKGEKDGERKSEWGVFSMKMEGKIRKGR